jgi:hypothetical protein
VLAGDSLHRAADFLEDAAGSAIVAFFFTDEAADQAFSLHMFALRVLGDCRVLILPLAHTRAQGQSVIASLTIRAGGLPWLQT